MHSAFSLTPYFTLHLFSISSSVSYFFFFPKNSPGIVWKGDSATRVACELVWVTKLSRGEGGTQQSQEW